MNTGDKVKEEIAKFANSPPQAQANVIFSSQKEIGSKVEYAKMRKIVLELLQQNQYTELKEKMASYSKSYIEAFFLVEGNILLSWALTATENTNALSFLVCDCNLSPQILIKTLRNDEYYILKSFLRGQTGIENTLHFNQQIIDIQIEKFKLLLKIDAQGVSEFMEKNSTEKFVTEIIRQNFSNALKLYKNIR